MNVVSRFLAIRLRTTRIVLLALAGLLIACSRSPEAVPAESITPIQLPTAVPTVTPPAMSTPRPAAGMDSTREAIEAWANSYQPGDPTATPPGEWITEPNYLAGKQAYKDEDYAEVLRRMDLVITADPSLAPAYWFRAMSYWDLGDYEPALEAIEQALALDPNYALGYSSRGLIRLSIDETDPKVAEDILHALSLDPSIAVAYNNVGVYYHNIGDIEKAIEAYEMALQIDDSRGFFWSNAVLNYLQKSDYLTCIERGQEGIERLPENWDLYNYVAECSADIANFYQAVEYYDLYLAAEPDDYKAIYNRGLSHRYLGHNEEALADYTRALELEPDFLFARINRGNVYVDLRLFESALTDYDLALEQGQVPLAMLGRGDALRGLGRYDEALAEYMSLLGLIPGNPEAGAGIALVYADMGRYEAAIETADQVLASGAPTGKYLGWAYLARGRANLGLENYSQAIEDLQLVGFGVDVVEGDYYLGLAFQGDGQIEKAIQHFELFLQSATPDMTEWIADARARLDALKGP